MTILPRLSGARRDVAINEITEDAVPRRSFYVLVLLSTAIASYGLLANSTAVVIGAMLIAPLMGPIYGIALGLIRDDRRLLLLAGISEAVGIVIAVGLAVAIGLLPLRPDFGTEIITRTRPNLYDLVVAIVAGVAGGYARTSERVSPTLPGVAIATALVPPLAACGLCLADARWDAALGAFLLFTTNFLAIEVAAGIVFVTAGLAARPRAEGITAGGLARRFAIPIVLLIPIAAFLLNTLITIVRDDRLSKNLRRVLGEDLRSVVGASVTELSHQRRGDELQVVVVVLTPQSIDSTLVATIEGDLQKRIDPAIHLIMRSLISRDADRAGQVFLDDKLRRRLRGEREQQAFLTSLSAGLRQSLQSVRGAELVDVRREDPDSNRVRATVRTPIVIDPGQVRLMQEAAAESTRAPIQLVVRSVLTRDADGRQYLDEDPKAVLQQRALETLTALLARRAPDADLMSVRVADGPEAAVTAILVGSRPGQQLVDQFNRALSQTIGRPTRLIVRSMSHATMTSRESEAVAARRQPSR